MPHFVTPAVDLDTQLMIRVQADDDSSFGTLLNRNRNLVVSYLYRMVANRAVAEELAQDVFVRVYRSRQTYEPTARFSTWLYRITTNVALNHFRDGKLSQNDVSLDVPDAAHARREASDQAPPLLTKDHPPRLRHRGERVIRKLEAIRSTEKREAGRSRHESLSTIRQ